MKTWTKPILVKDTMELSQYSIAACSDEYYTISITCSSNHGQSGSHPAGTDSQTWDLTLSVSDYKQYNQPKYYMYLIQHADNYGGGSSHGSNTKSHHTSSDGFVPHPAVPNAS